MVERNPNKEPNTNHGINPQLLEFDRIAKETGAYNATDPRRQRLISEYLTTGATLAELVHIAKVKYTGNIHYLIRTGLNKVIERLPNDLQEHYQTTQQIRQHVKSCVKSRCLVELQM